MRKERRRKKGAIFRPVRLVRSPSKIQIQPFNFFLSLNQSTTSTTLNITLALRLPIAAVARRAASCRSSSRSGFRGGTSNSKTLMFRLCCGGGGGGPRKASVSAPSSSSTPPSAASGAKPITTTKAAAAGLGGASQSASAAGGDDDRDGSKTAIGKQPATTTTTTAVPSTSSNPPQTTSSFPPQDQIWPLITAATQRALDSKALCPIDTAVVPERLSDGGWSFVLRVASNLRSKDADGREQKRREDDAASSAASSPERAGAGAAAGSSRQRSPSPPPPVFNPFLPYDKRLWVAHLPPSHELLLNKFPVSMNHALVVTRDFEEQEDALNARDLAATWAVLDAMPGAGGMAFFNRGRESGASQRHKHLQVVPLPLHGDGGNADTGGGTGGGGASDWAPFEGVALAATAAAGAAPLSVVPLGGKGNDGEDGNGLPFRAFAARMPPRGGPTAEALEWCVAELVEAACGRAKSDDDENEEPFSFNLLLTRRVAVVVPRRSGRSGGSASCSPNAVAFAGSMLARSEEELAFVREKGPMAILADCGFPW